MTKRYIDLVGVNKQQYQIHQFLIEKRIVYIAQNKGHSSILLVEDHKLIPSDHNCSAERITVSYFSMLFSILGNLSYLHQPH